jgi:Flp pilus assembly pilin Flp
MLPGGKSMNFAASFKNFVSDESGQGITEYGAILAFVALLVAVVFSFASGTLTSAISQSFSTIVFQLNKLNNYTSSGST